MQTSNICLLIIQIILLHRLQDQAGLARAEAYASGGIPGQGQQQLFAGPVLEGGRAVPYSSMITIEIKPVHKDVLGLLIGIL